MELKETKALEHNGLVKSACEKIYSEINLDGRWWKFTYHEIVSRDKTSLDIFWPKDKSLTDLENLPEPDLLANEIIENLEAALIGFKDVTKILNL
jgi:type I restriction enzyme M protein